MSPGDALELFHWLSLAPLVVLAMRLCRNPRRWVIALGFAVSWLADWVAAHSGGSWVPSHFYPPLQLGLFAAAFGSAEVFVVLVVLAAWVALQAPLDSPDRVVTLVGSVMALRLGAGRVASLPILLYCGVGGCFYLLMTNAVDDYDRFMVSWWPHQWSRMAAFFAVCCYREERAA